MKNNGRCYLIFSHCYRFHETLLNETMVSQHVEERPHRSSPPQLAAHHRSYVYPYFS